MPATTVYFWKKAPFVRLPFALMAGIILQWHWQVNPSTWWIVFISGMLVSSSFFFLSFFNRYQLGFINGGISFFCFPGIGCFTYLA